MSFHVQSISAAQVASMPGRAGVIYRLDVAPFTAYIWTGTAMQALGPVLSSGKYGIQAPDGSLIALSELWAAGAVLNYSAASQQASAVACEYGGFIVRAVTGTVNVVAHDDLASAGVPIQTANAVALGTYPMYGTGMNARRQNTVGLSFIMTGGGTISLEPMKA